MTVDLPDRPGAVVKGVAKNLSLEGVGIRLREALPEGCEVHVAVAGAPPRAGVVRWVEAHGDAILHGVQFEVGLDRRGTDARPLLRIRARRLLRRLLFWLIGLILIGCAAYALVWWMEEQRRYAPKYYEPKDVEREFYDIQRSRSEAKPGKTP